ncbi:CvpA family protein [Bacteroidales bacterium OttesenSCG-928-I21]|nr:CvpA family protein [Bacteroidales bacterium OttesenSCG-928-I21]
MNVFDFVLIILIGIFTIKGFKNGLIKELGSLVALVVGVFISIRFSGLLESMLRDKDFFSAEYLPIISYIITFIVVVVLVMLIAKTLNKFMKFIKLQWLNKLAGMIFGTLKIVIIVGSIFFVVTVLNEKLEFLTAEQLNKSLLFNPILLIFEFIFPYVKLFFN